MTAERWQRIKHLLDRVRDCDPQERAAILNEACGSDTLLRSEVEALLAAEERISEFQQPVAEGSAAAPDKPVTPGWSAADNQETELLPGIGGPLVPGSVLGGRYEIQQLLGRGGMGAVYKARDRKLDRYVALKVVRPEFADDAQILQRFRQELILARQVTHRNVIRIYDLGGADGFKYISMEYLEGRNLSSVLRERGKLAPEEAVGIMRQACQGLAAAHAEGVIHRDLKPQNIMIDSQGKTTVMDFGIARSLVTTAGMTQTGALLGTPAYMSPEQAKSEKVDGRSDLFSLGIIFYELLTGQVPFQSDTAMGSLLKRCQEPAVPPITLNPAVPKRLNEIIVRALATEPEARYQTAEELLTDLETWQTGTGARRDAPRPAPAWWWKLAALGVSALALAVAAWIVFRPATPVHAQKPISLLVADFDNRTGDPLFDGTLAPMFAVGMEGAAFINSYHVDQARRLAQQLQPSATRLDLSLARLLAAREGINVILTGWIARDAERFRVEVKAIDGVTGATIVTKDSGAVKRDGIVGAVGELLPGLRKALGDATPESLQLASAETFTSLSLEAAHDYALGQEQQGLGKPEESLKAYNKAVQEDPNFGRAYAGLASVYHNVGLLQQAGENYQKALAHLDRMSEREKYRTRGAYFLFSDNAQKAVEELSALVHQYPLDNVGYANLAYAYLYLRDMPHSLEAGRKAIEINPHNVLQRDNVALYAMYAGEFAESEREAQTVLQMNPAYEKAYVALGLSELAQGRPEKALEFYSRLQNVSKLGSALAADGQADVALYQGKTAEAVKLLEKSVGGGADERDASVAELTKLAEAYSVRGERERALSTVQRTLEVSQSPAVVFSAARVYLQAGQDAKALALASELAHRLEAEPRAYAKLLQGESLLKRGRFQDALDAFQDSRKLTDTWLAHFDLGQAYLGAHSLAEASSEFDLCLKRRGEATAVFLDEIPTYWLFPTVYYYLGRTQEELKSPGAAETFRTYISIKQDADSDPLVADARRRSGQPR